MLVQVLDDIALTSLIMIFPEAKATAIRSEDITEIFSKGEKQKFSLMHIIWCPN